MRGSIEYLRSLEPMFRLINKEVLENIREDWMFQEINDKHVIEVSTLDELAYSLSNELKFILIDMKGLKELRDVLRISNISGKSFNKIFNDIFLIRLMVIYLILVSWATRDIILIRLLGITIWLGWVRWFTETDLFFFETKRLGFGRVTFGITLRIILRIIHVYRIGCTRVTIIIRKIVLEW